MSTYRDAIIECRNVLNRTLKANQKALQKLPEGTFVVRTIKGSRYLYHSFQNGTGKRKEKLLNEKDRETAAGIQTRVALERQNKLIESNLDVVESFLKNYQPCDIQSAIRKLPPVYTSSLEYRGFQKADDLVQARNDNFYSDGLIHKNSIGQLFRSKGEVQVSEILLNHNIIYTYEPELKLPGGYVRPDFEVRLLSTDKPKYIEYCGMMDDPDYTDRTIHKIRNYLHGGYMLDRDVLFLFESGNSGMNVQTMKRRIEVFLNLK